MRCDRSSRRAAGLLSAAIALLSTFWPGAEGRADRIIMKNGLVYVSQGTPDKDNSLVYIWDGLKRVVVRDSKIEKMVPGNDYRAGERFQLIQPIVVHAGSMPKEVLSVEAGPWDERGRRTFRYLGSRVEPAGQHGAGDHRDQPAYRPLSAGSTGSGWASSRPIRSRTR